MIRLRGILASALVGAVVVASALGVLVAGDASARTAFQSSYTLEQNYSAALRMVRVDMGLKITEKDPDSAYIMFEYKSNESGQKVSSGAIELVPQESAVQVVVQLPQMPQYHEEVMATSLRRKLQQDYGDPPKRGEGREKDKKKKDAGADAAEGGADDGER
ncbi:MAG TPA: hypothetical protein PLI95_19695 [Polyangiaceae bacterium]|nr:hypothetical protein [Polyangiaceae bacterium]